MRTRFVFLFVLAMFFPSLAWAQSSEFELKAGQTVSGIVYEQLRNASLWRSADVVVVHPKKEIRYRKTDRQMRRLPVGTRVRISNKLIAARKPTNPVPVVPVVNVPAPAAQPSLVQVPPPVVTPAVVVPVPWYSEEIRMYRWTGIAYLLLALIVGLIVGTFSGRDKRTIVTS
jgi:hypothetical protein